MNENSKVLLICSIIGLFGMIIAAVINKSDFSWPKKEKQTQSTNKVSKTVDNNQLSKISLIPVNSSPEKENNHEAVNVKSDIIDFDKSVFIFNINDLMKKKRKFFLMGKFQ
jgi:cytoskeletal protein RodZ